MSKEFIGVGTDIIEVERIAASIERQGQRFLDRLFTPNEQEYCQRHRESARHYAGRFAAKEAIVKAFGTGISQEITWTDLEIINDERGRPEVQIRGELTERLQNCEIKVSISHCKEYATATALLLG